MVVFAVFFVVFLLRANAEAAPDEAPTVQDYSDPWVSRCRDVVSIKSIFADQKEPNDGSCDTHAKVETACEAPGTECYFGKDWSGIIRQALRASQS